MRLIIFKWCIFYFILKSNLLLNLGFPSSETIFFRVNLKKIILREETNYKCRKVSYGWMGNSKTIQMRGPRPPSFSFKVFELRTGGEQNRRQRQLRCRIVFPQKQNRCISQGVLFGKTRFNLQDDTGWKKTTRESFFTPFFFCFVNAPLLAPFRPNYFGGPRLDTNSSGNLFIDIGHLNTNLCLSLGLVRLNSATTCGRCSASGRLRRPSPVSGGPAPVSQLWRFVKGTGRDSPPSVA